MPNTYKKYKKNFTRKKYHGGTKKKATQKKQKPVKTQHNKVSRKKKSKKREIKHKSLNNKSKKPFIDLSNETLRLKLSKEASQLLVNGSNFEFISKRLQAIIQENSQHLIKYSEIRNAFAGSNPDNECKTASKYWELNSSDDTVNCRNYIDYTQRNKIQQIWKRSSVDLEKIDEKPIKKIVSNVLNFNNDKFDWINERNNDLRYIPAGKCWMCDEDVCFYFDKSGHKTGCGECEHVGSIIPSLLAGMLKQQDLSHFIYNYGFSHVHCNQNKGPKGNTTSMKFDNKKLKWVYDKSATNKIISNILKNNIHTNEYCPFYRTTLLDWRETKKSMQNQKKKIEIVIEEYTNIWLNKANDALSDHSGVIKDAVNFTKVINYFVKRCLDNSTAIKGGNLNHDEDFDITIDDLNNFMRDEIDKPIYVDFNNNLTSSCNMTLTRDKIERDYRAASRVPHSPAVRTGPSGPPPAPPSGPQLFSPGVTASNQQGNVTGDQTRGLRMITNEGADSGSLEAAIMGEEQDETDDDDRKE